jgi:energy-coupling factor transporter ATP-binding protein EcfA2
MKLEFVELAGFRGFRDKTRFVIPSGFSVLSGRNGSGKSTLLDAIDFAITGTINKYSVTEARGGGLDEHIWWVGGGKIDAHYVSVGFVDDSGEHFVITRIFEGLSVRSYVAAKLPSTPRSTYTRSRLRPAINSSRISRARYGLAKAGSGKAECHSISLCQPYEAGLTGSRRRRGLPPGSWATKKAGTAQTDTAAGSNWGFRTIPERWRIQELRVITAELEKEARGSREFSGLRRVDESRPRFAWARHNDRICGPVLPPAQPARPRAQRSRPAQSLVGVARARLLSCS